MTDDATVRDATVRDLATTDPARSQARQALDVAQRLRSQVRTDRRHPAPLTLLVMGALWALAAVVYRISPGIPPELVPGSGGGYRTPREDAWANLGGEPPDVAAAWFWVLAVPTAWAVCGWLFHRRRERGLGSKGSMIAAIGVLPFVLWATTELTIAPQLAAVHDFIDGPVSLVKAATAVAVGLVLVAAWDRHLVMGLVAGPFLVLPHWLGSRPWMLATTPWAPEVLDPSLQLLWWGLAMMLVGVGWWALQHRPQGARGRDGRGERAGSPA